MENQKKEPQMEKLSNTGIVGELLAHCFKPQKGDVVGRRANLLCFPVQEGVAEKNVFERFWKWRK